MNKRVREGEEEHACGQGSGSMCRQDKYMSAGTVQEHEKEKEQRERESFTGRERGAKKKNESFKRSKEGKGTKKKKSFAGREKSKGILQKKGRKGIHHRPTRCP